MVDLFSGRVFRLANSTPEPGWYCDSFVLSLEDVEDDREYLTERVGSVAHLWEVDVQEFAEAPKRAPAILYRRLIRTEATRAKFVAGYVKGRHSLPPGAPSRVDPTPIPIAARGNRAERAQVLRIEARALKADPDDPWYDVDRSYERYGARAVIAVSGGYEETIWFLSTGYRVSPRPILLQAVKAHALLQNGEVVGIDGPWAANNTGGIDTGLLLNRVFRRAATPEDFESRIVALSAWM